jgi:hypothetical protein
MTREGMQNTLVQSASDMHRDLIEVFLVALMRQVFQLYDNNKINIILPSVLNQRQNVILSFHE